MSRVILPRHGRNHRIGGSDPIPFPVTEITETSAVWGSILRDAGATTGITSGALNATTTLIAHNVVTEESGVDCDIVSSPTRIVMLEAGLYLIRSTLVDADSGSGDYGIAVGRGLNATGAVWSPLVQVRRVTTSPGGQWQGFSFLSLDIGDYVTQVVGQNSGTTKTFSYQADLTVVRIPGPITSTDVMSEIDGGSP